MHSHQWHHTRRIATALATTGAILLAIGIGTSSAPEAHADISGAAITAAPSSGSNGDQINVETTGLGCANDWAGVFILRDPITSVTVDLVNEMLGNVVSPSLDSFYLAGNPTTNGDDFVRTGPNGNFVNWQSGAGVADLKTMAQQWGAASTGTSYPLVTVCVDPTTFAPLSAPDGSAVAAQSTITIMPDGSWQIGSAKADVSAVAVTATQDQPGGSTVLTATVTDTTAAGTVPAGTVQFLDGTGSSATPLSQQLTLDSTGTATYTTSLTVLPVGTHTITAVYTPGAGVNIAGTSGTATVTVAASTPTDTSAPTPTDSSTPTPTDTSTPVPTDTSTPTPTDTSTPGGTLLDGGTVVRGTAYAAVFPAGTFGDGDSIDVVLHSTPTDLGTVTAGSDGSLTFTLTAAQTSALAAGSSHELVFTDATTPADSQTVAFTVAAAPSSTSTSNPGSTDPSTGTNTPSTFLTDSTRWATGTPQGVASLVGFLVLAAGAGLFGWNWFSRRRARVRQGS